MPYPFKSLAETLKDSADRCVSEKFGPARRFSEVGFSLKGLPRDQKRDGRGSKPMGSHFGVGAPSMLEPILVGIGMFNGGTGF